MGFMDRLHDTLTGFGGALQAPYGLVLDLARTPFDDDKEYEASVGAISAHFGNRGAQVIENLFGPDEGYGAVIGGLPKPVRQGGRKVFEGMETAYREAVAEPIAAATYVDSQGGSLFSGSLFSGENWREGFRRAEFTSPGQGVVLGVTGKNEKASTPELLEEQLGRWEHLASGVTDVLTRLYLDPTFVGAKTGMALRAARNPIIRGAEDLERVAGTRQFERATREMEGKSAAEIRDRFFPELANGGALSVALAEARDPVTRAAVLRLAMGDRNELARIYQSRADIAGQLERLTGEQTMLRSLDADNFARVNSPEALRAAQEVATAAPARDVVDLTRFDAPVPGGVVDEFPGAPVPGVDISAQPEIARIQAEIASLWDKETRLARDESFMGSLITAPKDKLTGEIRSASTRSDFYQKSRAAAPLRVTFNMRPGRFVDLNNPAGDIAISRQLKKSGLPLERQDALRTGYMAAVNPEQRAAALIQAEEESIAEMARVAGLSPEEIKTVVARASNGRQQAREVLSSRVYDGEGRSRMRYYDDGELVTHEVPLLVSQTADMLPLSDLDAVRKALKPIGEFKARHPSTEVPEDLMNIFYRVWKPSVLLRVGWPIRVVGDEQLRIMGKIGVLAQLKNLGPGIGNISKNALERTRAGLGETDTAARLAAREAAPRSGMGIGEIDVAGYKLEGAFGNDAAAPNAFFELSSSRPTFDNLVGRSERAEVENLRAKTQNWQSLHPVDDAESYGPAWANAVNNQLANDPLARVFLAGGTLEDGVRFLGSTEGRAHKARLKVRAAKDSDEKWAGAVKEQVDSYTLGSPKIMELALKQRATTEDLFRLTPDAAQRPIVHGALLDAAMRRGATMEWLNNTVTKAYNGLGSVPSDTLSRHPFFDAMYRAEAGRLTHLLDDQAGAGRLNADELRLIERKSREYALQQTQKILYNLGDESDLSHMLRFLSPFFSAWQETMTTWAGIAVQNPAYMLRLHQVWASPERAGLITDEYGNPVGPGENRGDEKVYADGTKSKIGRERYLTLPVPAEALSKLGLKGVRTGQTVRFNKKSFNLMLQGAPGFGAPVQIPVNQIVKDRPDLAASMRFVLPFGAQQSLIQSLLPATAKRLDARAAGEEDRAFRNATIRIYMDSIVDYKLGKRDTVPSWDEALAKGKDFYNLRAVASFVLPAAPGFQSPYQVQLDTLRRLRAMDPLTADEKFLDMYGDEFFTLTQSFTKTADGVPPTVEAFQARTKYKDLIEKHPEMGALIIGSEGVGEFSSSVYQSQLANKVAPGSIENQRNARSLEEIEAGPDERLGWMEYQKLSDLIEAERIDRGLPNLRVKAAEDLALAKRAATQALAAKHPDWYAKFSVTDRNAMSKKLEGLRAIAADERMAVRPEFQGLRLYLQLRDLFRQVLAVRKTTVGTAAMDAAANTDVAAAWATLTGKLVEQNLAFSALFTRHLDRDNLEAA